MEINAIMLQIVSSISDLIPGMTVIFSDGDFTSNAHSEAAYLALIRALC